MLIQQPGAAVKPKTPALGRGLSSLIPVSVQNTSVHEVPLSLIDVVSDQPRRYFDDPALKELAESIRQTGVLQPLLVAREGERYRLIAGERRLRAAKMAGLSSVPVMIRQATEREAFVLALVENLQREDLNPIEQARAFQRLIEEFGMTQDDVAKRVGKQRATIANSLRLLKLASPVLSALEEGKIAEGTARALLPLEGSDQELLLERIVKEGLSTRQVEAIVASARRKQKKARVSALTSFFENARQEIADVTGLEVRLTYSGNRGRLIFPFTSLKEFRQICDVIKKCNQGS